MRKSVIGFTLIELLIVVAIIAILAAIAIPNFLAAQIRAKVSRVKGELRTLATGLESYRVDNNEYPNDILYNGSYICYVSDAITTPIAYITSNYFIDPFRSGLYNQQDSSWLPYRRYRYINYEYRLPTTYVTGRLRYGPWRLSSSGPDKTATYNDDPCGSFGIWLLVYDPTNGTVSNGDIIRSATGNDTRPYRTDIEDY